MTKVCHMTSAHDKEDVRIFRKECVSLAKAGYDVTLVERGESYEKNGVHIIGVGYPSGRFDRMTAFAKKVYDAALNTDADIYHIHDPELLPYSLALKKRGKKVIFDSHELYTEQFKFKPYLPKAVSLLLAFSYGCLEKHCLKKIDAVVFPCTMQGVNPFEGKCRRAELIGNAVIPDEFCGQSNETYPKIANQICYIGSLTKSRGITMDVKAVKNVGGALVLAGEFMPREYLDELKTLEEFSCVDYRGKLNRDGIRRLLAESQVGLCTLLDQGQYLKADNLATKVYEYMAMGLPVVLSKSKYNEKVVNKYHFGICVDPGSTDEIASAINYLLENPSEAKIMGENGRRAVHNDLNWEAEEKKLIALYDDM